MIAANRGNAFSKSIALDSQKKQKDRLLERSQSVVVPNWCGGVVVVWCDVAAQLPNWCGRTVARHKGLALLPLELPARNLFEHCPLLVAA